MMRQPMVSRPARGIRGGRLRALLAATAVVAACTGPRQANDSARDLIQDTRKELSKLGLRFDELDRRLDEVEAEQSARSAELETRSTEFESRLGRAEDDGQAVGFIRTEIGRIKEDIARLSQANELDSSYRRRVENLELRLEGIDGEVYPDDSIDHIWSWYVSQRFEIDLLSNQLSGGPKP